MGIVPILFSAAGAGVFSFVAVSICMICFIHSQKAPTMYDTTVVVRFEKRKVHNILHLEPETKTV